MLCRAQQAAWCAAEPTGDAGCSLRATKLATVLGTSFPYNPTTMRSAKKIGLLDNARSATPELSAQAGHSGHIMSAHADRADRRRGQTCRLAPHSQIKVHLISHLWICMGTAQPGLCGDGGCVKRDLTSPLHRSQQSAGLLIQRKN